ncbi:MAG TPA: ankyrin repeat domain-containing protein [Bryobacteraceae bacterium]|jgi:ankyrin repeat protein|nr:ankyrin repeat domain-containing protein [Bryobacteraceae bacterium]
MAARLLALLMFGIGLLAYAGTEGAGSKLADAVRDGDRAGTLALLKQHADVNLPEPDGTSALHWAVRQDDREIADRLIKAGANVKAANRYGVTPLYLACVNGSALMIARLLDAGADANAAATEGETALMTVARTGNVEAAKVLLAHGADVNSKEQWRQQTPLMWAVAESHPEMAQELIAHGADVNARQVTWNWERQITKEPREKWMPLGGLTPLLFAARQGCLDCARILLKSGAEINAADPNNISPVLLATINGHYDFAAFLLEQGADPNIADETGRTALFAAVDMHTMPASNRPSPLEVDNNLTSMDLIRALLAHGANVNAQLKKMQPYRTKLDRGDDTMLGTGTTPILRAAKAGDAEAIQTLLAKGADPKIPTKSGITPLMAAAGLGTKEEDTTARKKTEADAIASLKLFVDAGVDVNAADGQGQTALHGAAQKGWDQVVQFLVDHGAKLDVKDKRGRTPLDAAMGLLGNGGFDGTRRDVHESTAALLRKLMAVPEAKAAQ